MILPTYLYVKQHSVTGLKYFGKTTVNDPIKYVGSGIYWTRHIKKHGKDFVNTLWLSEPFTDENLLEEFALLASEHWDIVSSDEWANLILENGLDGGTNGYKFTNDQLMVSSTSKLGNKYCLGNILTPEHKDNVSISMKGKQNSLGHKQTQEHIDKCIAKRSKNFIIIDPNGILHEGKNLKEFCRDNDLFYDCIRRVVVGKINQYKGWCHVESPTIL